MRHLTLLGTHWESQWKSKQTDQHSEVFIAVLCLMAQKNKITVGVHQEANTQ